MSDTLALQQPLPATSAHIWQNAALWLLICSGFLAFIEPSPYEVMVLVAATVFVLTGLRVHRAMAPLLVGVILFNLGGAFALIPFLAFRDSVFFVVISFYMGLTSLFYACIILERTAERLRLLQGAWTLAACCASLCGILGYFDVAGTFDLFTLYGRASGTFKDPNVFGPFVAVPIVLVFHSWIEKPLARPLLGFFSLVLMTAGVFLSFSRGAWGLAILGVGTASALTFLVRPEPRVRARIIIFLVAGVLIFAALLSVALSIDSISNLFEQRFALVQDYDGGSQGRFGKLTTAINMLLELPNGFGPLRFETHFPEAPHNVYVSAFASYGWLGGLTYLAMMMTTMWVGWSTVAIAAPWRSHFIAIWSVTFWQIIQGLQIDTDHWRHFWLLIGLTWGLACASRLHAAKAQVRTSAARTRSP